MRVENGYRPQQSEVPYYNSRLIEQADRIIRPRFPNEKEEKPPKMPEDRYIGAAFMLTPEEIRELQKRSPDTVKKFLDVLGVGDNLTQQVAIGVSIQKLPEIWRDRELSLYVQTTYISDEDEEITVRADFPMNTPPQEGYTTGARNRHRAINREHKEPSIHITSASGDAITFPEGGMREQILHNYAFPPRDVNAVHESITSWALGKIQERTTAEVAQTEATQTEVIQTTPAQHELIQESKPSPVAA